MCVGVRRTLQRCQLTLGVTVISPISQLVRFFVFLFFCLFGVFFGSVLKRVNIYTLWWWWWVKQNSIYLFSVASCIFMRVLQLKSRGSSSFLFLLLQGNCRKQKHCETYQKWIIQSHAVQTITAIIWLTAWNKITCMTLFCLFFFLCVFSFPLFFSIFWYFQENQILYYCCPFFLF